MKLERLLAITIILLNNDKVQAKDLADRFEVSIRTIYRDLETINMSGIPIISYPGNNGGYGIMDTFKIDKHIFSDSDIESVLSTLKGISNSLDDTQLDSALEKLMNIGLSRNKNISQLNDKIIVDIFRYGASAKQKEAHKLIYYAINNSRLINFEYINALGEATVRTIEPMTLVFKNFSWYLFAFCKLKDDFRFFKLTRIRNINVSVQSFVRREAKYGDYELSAERNYQGIELIVKFNARIKHRIEEYFPENISEYLPDGSPIVKLNWKEDDWIYSFILSYGDDAEIISPQHIRENYIKKIKNISVLYQT